MVCSTEARSSRRLIKISAVKIEALKSGQLGHAVTSVGEIRSVNDIDEFAGCGYSKLRLLEDFESLVGFSVQELETESKGEGFWYSYRRRPWEKVIDEHIMSVNFTVNLKHNHPRPTIDHTVPQCPVSHALNKLRESQLEVVHQLRLLGPNPPPKRLLLIRKWCLSRSRSLPSFRRHSLRAFRALLPVLQLRGRSKRRRRALVVQPLELPSPKRRKVHPLQVLSPPQLPNQSLLRQLPRRPRRRRGQLLPLSRALLRARRTTLPCPSTSLCRCRTTRLALPPPPPQLVLVRPVQSKQLRRLLGQRNRSRLNRLMVV